MSPRKRRTDISLVDRVRRSIETGDATEVLSPAAVADAARLIIPAIGADISPQALQAVGMLHWLRHCVRPPDADQSDLKVCIELFAPLAQVAPAAVPPPVLDWLATDGGPGMPPAAIGPFYATVITNAALTADDLELTGLGIAACRAAVEAGRGAGDPAHQFNLMLLLYQRFDRTAAEHDLDEAIAAGRAALGGADHHPIAALVRHHLGIGLIGRFRTRGHESDLVEGTMALRDAVSGIALDDPNRVPFLSELAAALQEHAALGGPLALLDELVEVSRVILGACAADDPAHGDSLVLLGAALRTRFIRTRAAEDIAESVRCGRAAVEHSSVGTEFHAVGLLNLANALQIRSFSAALSGGDGGTDGAEALALIRAADAAVPAGHPLRWEVDAILATVLNSRGTDPAGAVRAARATLAGLPPGSRHRGKALLSLGEALRLSYQETREDALLREAIAVLKQATAYAGPLDRTPMVVALSMVLHESVKLGVDDLDEAIETTRTAIADLPDVQVRGGQLWQLADLLGRRFDRDDRAGDLDERIDVLRAAVPLAPSPDTLAMCLSALSVALQIRYQREWDRADLDESAAAMCRTVDVLPAGHPELPGRQAEAAQVLQQRFNIRGEQADLVTATRLIRTAIDTAGADDPDRHRKQRVLASVLATAAMPGRDVAGLSEAIQAGLAATPPDVAPNASTALELGNALLARYEATGEEADLETAATVLRDAITPATGQARGLLTNSLVSVLRARFHRHGDAMDLDEAIESGRSAIEDLPQGHPDRLLSAANVAHTQADRFDFFRNQTDLTEAVDSLRSVLDRARGDDPATPLFWLYLGRALGARSYATGGAADLDEAIGALRTGLASAGPQYHRVPGLTILGSLLLLRAERSHAPAELAEAVELLRTAHGSAAVTDVDHYAAGVRLARALQVGYLNTADPTQLTESIEIAREVVSVVPDNHQLRSSALQILGTSLTQQFQRVDDLATITESVDVLRAAAASGTSEVTLGSALAELANALCFRHNRSPAPEDLDEAIVVARRAATLPAATPEERSTYLTALSGSLLARSVLLNDEDDLKAAIDASRGATSAQAGPFVELARLTNLGLALWARFERTAAAADLHEAIDTLSTVAATAHIGHAFRPRVLTNLSTALRARAGLHGSSADLDAAVRAARSAVEAAPADHPQAPQWLMHLGMSHYIRFAERHDTADSDAAIMALSDALDRSPTAGPQRAQIASNLASLFRSRGIDDRRAGDLDRAVELAREAIAITDPAHPNHPLYSINLANSLRSRHAHGGQDVDAVEGLALARDAIANLAAGNPRVVVAWLLVGWIQRDRSRRRSGPFLDETAIAFRIAAGLTSAPPMLRMLAATEWAKESSRRADWASATLAFGEAVALLPQVAWHGVDRGARERRLIAWEGLAAEAAAAALAAGSPDRAVELLEQGRSVLWSQALQTKDDLSELRERDPALHDRLRALAALQADTDTPDVLDTSIATDAWSDPVLRDRSVQITRAEGWDRLLAEARALPGLEYLLRVPPLAMLCDGLPDGPVVLLTLHRTRCDALIVRRDRGVEHIPLPGLSHAEAAQRASGYLNALRSLENGRGLARTSARQTLHATLEWLWDNVTEPVLTHLGYTGWDNPLPRLWWCPTGSLTLLPLHAAGYHDPADQPAGRTVLDRVVSSYTPTLRALARANTASASTSADQRVLVVSMPETPAVEGIAQLTPLPGARAEADFLAGAMPHTLRTADTATHAGVTADLRNHAYAHFACHGGQNLQEPSTGALYLRDKPLTVLDVAGLDLTHAELAYLSACSTAIGGTTLPDEAIHLAAALQLAGYRHVIATLWTIADRTAVDLTVSMYTGLLGPSGLRLDHTARLLHGAVRALRDSAPRDPTIWASYIHSGP
ncbi:CHAT domain-containing protein [Actinokineospora sp. G85]|uniref:CHAT domain-containing protein n=1 Tax=Actinokineospora sp. G85 TaxID=3406626 RepID=UPI003C77F08A